MNLKMFNINTEVAFFYTYNGVSPSCFINLIIKDVFRGYSRHF